MVYLYAELAVVDIPYFKEVIIMATLCNHCGYRSNEVKTGGAIAPRGRKITLKLKPEDMSRDILKVHLLCTFRSECRSLISVV